MKILFAFALYLKNVSMKRFVIIILLLFFGFNVKSQITMEQSFPNQRIDLVHLRSAGIKYFLIDYANYSATLLNLDYSVFRTISFPHISHTNYSVNFFSEDLFDTDSTTIEYILSFIDTANSGVRIYSGDSTLIFQADSGAIIYGNEYGAYQAIPYVPIFNTDSGTKMIVAFTTPSYETRIYSLPGKLPQSCNSSCLTNGVIQLMNKQERIKAYPNPFITSEIIEYSLPQNTKVAELVITDESGKIIHQYPLLANDNKIETIHNNLPAGSYLLTIKSGSEIIATKKVLKIN